jgi:hypothetical protein
MEPILPNQFVSGYFSRQVKIHGGVEQLTRGSRDTVGGGAVAGGEALAGDDEGGGVGAEVEEELGQHVDGEKAVGGDVVISETHDDEEDGEDGEAHELDGLAADDIDSGHGEPVTGHGTSEHDDQVTDGSIVEVLVGGGSTGGRVTDDGQDGGVVERQTVVGNIEEAP